MSTITTEQLAQPISDKCHTDAALMMKMALGIGYLDPRFKQTCVELLESQQALLALVDSQSAEIARLQKDAARYRWLRTTANASIFFQKHVRYFANGQSIETRYPLENEMDIAIDAAQGPRHE